MASCPDENQLLAMVSGKLSRLLALPLQSHIESCRRCQASVAEAARSFSRATTPAPLSRLQRLGKGSVLDGRYELTRILGEGGSGVVWSALHRQDGRVVAIKVLRSVSPEQIQRLLQREARLSQRVEHPAFVPVHEVLMLQPNQPALVMECLQGRDLAAHLNEKPQLSLPDAIALLAPLASALVVLHAQKIAHRDLKPANVFLEKRQDGTVSVRILDLGMALSLDTERGTLSAARITAKGTLLGTPRFMAPEQLDGRSEVGAAADVWAFGAIAFRLLSGRDHIRASTPAEVVRVLYVERIPELSALAPEVPEVLAQLVDSSLQMSAEARPTAAQWEQALSCHTQSALAP